MRELTSTGRENFSACVAMIVVTTVLMLVRLAVRATQRQGLFGSDWTCMLSLAFFYAYCAVILNFILNTSQYGSLDANVMLGIDEMRNILKMTFVAELLMGFVITLVKISILWFYYKAFVTGQDMFKKRLIQASIVACVLWLIGVTFFIIFACNPIHAYWDMFGQAPYCMSSVRFLLGYEISNLFLDVWILAIPIPILMRLQMQQSKKISLIVVFILGAFVCIASIIRITKIWNPPNVDLDFNYSAAMLWSTLQLGIAITCACLPTLGPILVNVSMQLSQIRSWGSTIFTRSRTRGQSGRNAYKMSQDSYEMPHDVPSQPTKQATRVYHGQPESWAESQGRLHNGQGQFYEDVERASRPSDRASRPSDTVLVERDYRVSY